MRTLTIISHTEHYQLADGSIVGLGSTVTEINHLLDVFDAIIHVAMLHATDAPKNTLPYCSENITFVALPAVGGTSFADKLSVLWVAPKVLKIIGKSIAKSSYFQFRAPTGIGVYVIPYLMWFSNKEGWYKYAGNWKQKNAPFAYRFQKWLLEHQSRPVTINGFWEDQPEQCLSFENPCLTEHDLMDGAKTLAGKQLTDPINLCFVGRLEASKGIDLLLDAIMRLTPTAQEKIGKVHIVGDGERLPYYKNKISTCDIHFIFHGFLSRSDVQKIYKASHAIILPSASEGFPKVIAEAMNYGCVPIVSDISCLGHYILDGQNGFLLKDLTSLSLQESLSQFLGFSTGDYNNMIATYSNFVKAYTYNHYNCRLQSAIL